MSRGRAVNRGFPSRLTQEDHRLFANALHLVSDARLKCKRRWNVPQKRQDLPVKLVGGRHDVRQSSLDAAPYNQNYDATIWRFLAGATVGRSVADLVRITAGTGRGRVSPYRTLVKAAP